MKLIYKITIRISLILVVLLTVWATLFYYAIMDEVNDEVDDALEDYSEMLITRHLAGYPLPPKVSGSNNSYFIKQVANEYAKSQNLIKYNDTMAYIPEKRETEPARMLTTIFKDRDDVYFELVVSIPTIEKEDLIEAILHWIIILYAGLLLTIILVNVYVFHGSLKPLYKLLNWLDNYKIGGKNAELKNDTTVTEFRQLNESTLSYVGRTEAAFEQQKQFIGNASHEMQTPLAICDNRLEWLIDNTELEENQLEEILKTKKTLNYLVKLNKSLLFISKIDNGQFPESSIVNINSLLKQHLEVYQEIYESRKMVISIKETGQLTVQINEVLVTSLISNLLRNAYVHNVEGGKIELEITNGGLSISNTAISGPLDGNRIFERFYQGSKKEGSTGLGLAIVKAVCKLYDISLSYHYIYMKHQFRLVWKKTK